MPFVQFSLISADCIYNVCSLQAFIYAFPDCIFRDYKGTFPFRSWLCKSKILVCCLEIVLVTKGEEVRQGDTKTRLDKRIHITIVKISPVQRMIVPVHVAAYCRIDRTDSRLAVSQISKVFHGFLHPPWLVSLRRRSVNPYI